MLTTTQVPTAKDFRLADNIDTTPEELDRLLAMNNYQLNNKVAAHPRTSQATLQHIYETVDNGYVLSKLASNPSIPPWMAMELSKHTNHWVRSAALKNAACPEEAAYARLDDPQPWVRFFANRKLGRWAKAPIKARGTGISTHGNMGDDAGRSYRKSTLTQEEREARLKRDIEDIKNGIYKSQSAAESLPVITAGMSVAEEEKACAFYGRPEYIKECQDPEVLAFLVRHGWGSSSVPVAANPHLPYEDLVEVTKWGKEEVKIAALSNPAADEAIHKRMARYKNRNIRLALAAHPLVNRSILDDMALEDNEVGERARGTLSILDEVVEMLTAA